jgi:D-alanine--poly(phosphoribitol) ligase subunit 1
MDNQVKLHGHRIELGDIEANLRALPGIRDAVALPVRRGDAVDALVACVVLAGGARGSDFDVANELRSMLAARVPAYMIPRRFRFFEALPMTINGKTDRRELERLVT